MEMNAGRFLDRINMINRILAWRTGDTEDRVFGMENRGSRRKTGVAAPCIDPPAALASLGGYPAPAEGGPKLSCISCSTCLKNNPVKPV